MFGVKVLSVNTLNRPGKRKRSRTGYGKRKDTKRAIVTLSEESRAIDVFHLTQSTAKLPQPVSHALKADLERLLQEGS